MVARWPSIFGPRRFCPKGVVLKGFAKIQLLALSVHMYVACPSKEGGATIDFAKGNCWLTGDLKDGTVFSPHIALILKPTIPDTVRRHLNENTNKVKFSRHFK